jgi:hypothetical protein
MAITARAYGRGVLFIVNNDVDWVADTIHASLHLSTYTPDPDAHDFFNDATNEVAAGSGYSAGGVALTTKTATIDTANDRVVLSADPIAFAFVGSKTWRHMVLYKKRGGASSADELIAYYTWDSDQTKSTTHTLTPDATSGLIRLPY